MQSVILVTGATGNVGRHVVSQMLRAGTAAHAVTRNPDSVGLPNDIVRGDLSVPDTLDACLDPVQAGVLDWPFFTAAPELLDAVTKHGRHVAYLSSEGVGDDLGITARIAAKLGA